MNMYEISKNLEKEIGLPGNVRYFKEANIRLIDLWPFNVPEDIVKFFRHQDEENNDLKAYLLKIMLIEHQANPHQLWSGILILCFTPWLTNCCRRAIDNSDLDPEELTMLVVESFLESASNMKTDRDSICILTMLMNTQRKVIQYIEKERERRSVETMAQVVDWKKAALSGLNPEELMILGQLNLDDEQMKQVSKDQDEEILDLLFDMVMNNDTVTDYVRRKHAEKNSDEFLKHYRRINKRLHRLRKKIKLDV